MTLEGFWSRVDKTEGCWLWTAGTTSRGYGRARFPGRGHRMVSAHRVSYELEHGAIPAGMLVLHKCDVPRCVRPDHLFLGTAQDNASDMAAKGRAGKPIGHHQNALRVKRGLPPIINRYWAKDFA